MITRNHRPVAVAYAERHAKVDKLLATLATLVKQHAEEISTWPHVGDLQHVEDILMEAIRFLKGKVNK